MDKSGGDSMNRYHKQLLKSLMGRYPLVKKEHDKAIADRMKSPPQSSGIIVIEPD
jgi:hypothetical protein